MDCSPLYACGHTVQCNPILKLNGANAPSTPLLPLFLCTAKNLHAHHLFTVIIFIVESVHHAILCNKILQTHLRHLPKSNIQNHGSSFHAILLGIIWLISILMIFQSISITNSRIHSTVQINQRKMICP